MAIKDDIKGFFKGEVEDNDEALTTYSHDTSLFEVRPKLVTKPKDVEDIKALVAYVATRSDHDLSLTARSAGTDMSGGDLTESVVVSLTEHLNRIKEIGDGYAVTEPGVFYRDFEKATLEKGQLLPSYPASREICTVGGMVANNSGGEKSLRYGKTQNFVKKIKVVLRDGEEHEMGALDRAALDAKMQQQDLEGDIYRRMYKLVTENEAVIKDAKPRVSKNSAGYYLWDVWDGQTFDLAKLLTGSQGTLGIITEATLRLVRPDPHSRLLVIFLKDFARLPEVVKAVLERGPESFETYDDHTLKVALRYWHGIAKQMGAKNVFSMAWRFLPEAGFVLRHGMPKQFMIAEFTGATSEEVDEKAQAAKTAVSELGLPCRLTTSEADAKKYWTIRRESFNLLRKHFKKKHTAPFIDDLIVLPEKLPQFLPELNAILEPYKLMLTIVGHIGDGNFHIIPLMDMSDPKTPKIIEELSTKVYDLVLKYGGSITGEHNDGLVRSPYLEQMYGDKVYALFEETKRIFDPDNIFNPGKKVGATMDYAMRHLNRK